MPSLDALAGVSDGRACTQTQARHPPGAHGARFSRAPAGTERTREHTWLRTTGLDCVLTLTVSSSGWRTASAGSVFGLLALLAGQEAGPGEERPPGSSPKFRLSALVNKWTPGDHPTTTQSPVPEITPHQPHRAGGTRTELLLGGCAGRSRGARAARPELRSPGPPRP